jgi:hypothetical protein
LKSLLIHFLTLENTSKHLLLLYKITGEKAIFWRFFPKNQQPQPARMQKIPRCGAYLSIDGFDESIASAIVGMTKFPSAGSPLVDKTVRIGYLKQVR